jgi:2-keto-4-pentenoate hydratase/2-oxohepta-3-ene-1,7-dioic acid hydratase in catechol pathway
MSIDKIICVGKNYLDHAKELGDAIPEKPVIFLKPASVLRQVNHWNETLELNFPSEDQAVQPECEIVLQVAHDAYQLTREEAKTVHCIIDPRS